MPLIAGIDIGNATTE
ncbi:hypothetical protein, partial [Klebsiella pneumoniae]